MTKLLSTNESIRVINQALAAGNQLRLHQNGFIQLDMMDGVSRLHIWADDMLKAQDPRTPIHNHRFCFESQVILGQLTHVEYEWLNEETHMNNIQNNDPVCELFTGAGDYEHLVSTGQMGTVHMTGQFQLPAGRMYSFSHGFYHDSWGHGLTATIMTKTEVDCIPFATVVVPLGEGGPDNNFRRDQYPQSDMMEYVARVLEALHELDNRRHV